MGRTLINALSFYPKELKITETSADSNVRDWNDRLMYEKHEFTYDDQETFDRMVVAYANDYLSGMIRLPRNHLLAKRVEYLKQHLMVEQANPDSLEWLKIKETEEAIDILTGRKRVTMPLFIITGDNDMSIKESKSTMMLVKKNKATKYISQEHAQKTLDRVARLSRWDRQYNLQIVRV